MLVQLWQQEWQPCFRRASDDKVASFIKAGKLSLPHYLLVNGQMIGVMKRAVKLEIPDGRYLVTVRSTVRFIESSVWAEVHENTENCVEFGDREKYWDIIFWIDMVLWLVKRIIDVGAPWGMIYEICSNGFFAVWMLRVWIIRKNYFRLESFCKVKRENIEIDENEQ